MVARSLICIFSGQPVYMVVFQKRARRRPTPPAKQRTPASLPFRVRSRIAQFERVLCLGCPDVLPDLFRERNNVRPLVLHVLYRANKLSGSRHAATSLSAYAVSSVRHGLPRLALAEGNLVIQRTAKVVSVGQQHGDLERD